MDIGDRSYEPRGAARNVVANSLGYVVPRIFEQGDCGQP